MLMRLLTLIYPIIDIHDGIFLHLWIRVPENAYLKAYIAAEPWPP